MFDPASEDTLGVPYKRRTVRGMERCFDIVRMVTDNFNSITEMMHVMHNSKALNFNSFLEPSVVLHLLKSCLDGGTEVRKLIMAGKIARVAYCHLVCNVLQGVLLMDLLRVFVKPVLLFSVGSAEDADYGWGGQRKWSFNTLRDGVRLFVLRFRPKTSSCQLPYQCPSSSTDCTRELFKGSNESESLTDCTQKNFWLGVADFFWVTS